MNRIGWQLILSAALSLAVVAAPVPAQSDRAPLDLLATSIDIQVIAADREAAGEALARWAETTGGYFTYRSLERVELRVPNAQLSAMRDFIEVQKLEVIEYNPATIDLRSELRDIDAAVTSRREALDRILVYLEESTVRATLAFERELRSLNAEIERYAGRRRVLLNDIAYARVTIALSMRERTIPDWIPSSFAWMNTIDLYRFIDDIHNGGWR
jgi:hypothetical protein